MSTPPALIFEGGGMRGTYTAALVAEMIDAGLDFPWVGGISAGATHTCNFISRDAWRARASFVELAKDPNLGGPLSFVRGKGYFNSDYIYQHTSGPDELLPFNWDTFNSSDTQFKIGSFNCRTGETVYWGRRDISTQKELITYCQASSSMPVLMPPVDLGGVEYLDGAIGDTGGFAIDAAEADGYERFVVIMTRKRGYRKPQTKIPPTVYKKLFRKYPAVAEAILSRPQKYNSTLDRLEALESEGRAYLYFPDKMPISNGERNAVSVQAAYEEGLQQAKRDLPAIISFLQN